MLEFQNRFILALLSYCDQRNLSSSQLCKLSGIDFIQLKQNQSSLNPKQVNSLWNNASHLSHDELFGLHFGESMQLAALGAIGQIVQTSTTIRDALTSACTFTPYITDMFQMEVRQSKRTFKINFIHDPQKAVDFPFTFRHLADYLLSFVLHEMDGIILEKIAPNSIHLSYPMSNPGEYARVLRTTRIKKALGISMEFDSGHLSQQIISADYELQDMLLTKIAGLNANQNQSKLLKKRVYNYLLSNSYCSDFSQAAVAANFNTSPRTLQKKLKEEGTSFQNVVDIVRKTLAIHYLKNGSYQLKDISGILGYNEISSFSRAFKRWTGKSPEEFRNKAHSKP